MSDSSMPLGKAIDEFETSPSYSVEMRASLARFTTLCGTGCPMFTLTTGDVKEFAKEEKKAADRRKRIESLECFFAFAKEQGWIRSNPAAGIIKKKASKEPPQPPQKPPLPGREPVLLTAEGRYEIEIAVEELQARKAKVTAEVAAAREEGDLKENAGYHDARERLGLIDGQIKEKMDILKRSVLMD